MAMYIPSLITGFLLERLGLYRIMVLGAILMIACAGLAIVSAELIHFWGALVLLGLGWNLLFVGGTVLLTRTYAPTERFKAQAGNEFTVFGVQALASLSAGTMLYTTNWTVMNLLGILVLTAALAVVLRQRRELAVAVG
jgi:MFS family permease